MSQWRLLPFVLTAALGVLAPLGALAAPPGTLYILEGRVDSSSENFEKDVKAAARSAIGKSGDGWHLNFVAYMKKPPGSDEVNLVLYEGQPVPGKEINAYPIRTKATAKILMAEVDIKPEDGFKEGHKYQVLITRLISGHEEIYARTTLELK